MGPSKLSQVTLAEIGLTLVVIGFILALVAVVLLAVKARGDGGRTRGGAVLLIGPIPIIFGTDRESVKILVILAIILIVVVITFTFIPILIMR